MRLPKSPEQKRAAKAARQARWRANKAKREAITEAIDYSIGVGEKPKRPMPPVSDEDLAKLVRDRIRNIVADMDDDDLLNKEFAPGIALGLKAQSTLDTREKAKAKAALGSQWLDFMDRLANGGSPLLQLNDGNTVEGEFEDVTDYEAE